MEAEDIYDNKTIQVSVFNKKTDKGYDIDLSAIENVGVLFCKDGVVRKATPGDLIDLFFETGVFLHNKSNYPYVVPIKEIDSSESPKTN
jgi:hypothetical protein